VEKGNLNRLDSQRIRVSSVWYIARSASDRKARHVKAKARNVETPSGAVHDMISKKISMGMGELLIAAFAIKDDCRD
jgi:hypothetical protein